MLSRQPSPALNHPSSSLLPRQEAAKTDAAVGILAADRPGGHFCVGCGLGRELTSFTSPDSGGHHGTAPALLAATRVAMKKSREKTGSTNPADSPKLSPSS